MVKRGRNFWGDGDVFYFVCGGGFMGVDTC